MLGYVIKIPNSLPVAKWALKTSVNDYSWKNSNPPDMIELCISSADQRTVYYPGKPPRVICGTVVTAVVGDIAVRSCAPPETQIEIASISALIPDLYARFSELGEQELSDPSVIILPSTVDFLCKRELDEIERLFNKFTHCYMENSATARLQCASVFLDTLCRLDSYARGSVNLQKRDKYVSYYANKAKSLIDMKYSQRITLDYVASELGITPGYLSTVFKKTVGVSFSDALFEKRISAARKLVCEGALSVSEIADATGLGDESNLRRRFKQYFGTSIREYRNVIKEQTLYLEKPTRRRTE